MQPTVRAFEERDLDAVTALSLRAWAPVFASIAEVLAEDGLFAQMHPDWRADQRRAVQEACRTEGMQVWVAEIAHDIDHDKADGERGKAVAGFVAARLDQAERMGEIYMIAVDPPYQRHGVGALLTSVALQWFKASGMAMAMVETGGDPGHAPARRTYEHSGFVRFPVARYFKKL